MSKGYLFVVRVKLRIFGVHIIRKSIPQRLRDYHLNRNPLATCGVACTGQRLVKAGQAHRHSFSNRAGLVAVYLTVC